MSPFWKVLILINIAISVDDTFNYDEEARHLASGREGARASPRAGEHSVREQEYTPMHVVELTGLKSAEGQKLNGKTGFIHSFDESKARWNVLIDGIVKSFKQENIKKKDSPVIFWTLAAKPLFFLCEILHRR